MIEVKFFFSRQGQTGFPWIDAIMTQLREEGWIHHLARHAVACFLTRGDLWISWEEGMKVKCRDVPGILIATRAASVLSVLLLLLT